MVGRMNQDDFAIAPFFGQTQGQAPARSTSNSPTSAQAIELQFWFGFELTFSTRFRHVGLGIYARIYQMPLSTIG
jgi:hypothetical protein